MFRWKNYFAVVCNTVNRVLVSLNSKLLVGSLMGQRESKGKHSEVWEGGQNTEVRGPGLLFCACLDDWRALSGTKPLTHSLKDLLPPVSSIEPADSMPTSCHVHFPSPLLPPSWTVS